MKFRIFLVIPFAPNTNEFLQYTDRHNENKTLLQTKLTYILNHELKKTFISTEIIQAKKVCKLQDYMKHIFRVRDNYNSEEVQKLLT